MRCLLSLCSMSVITSGLRPAIVSVLLVSGSPPLRGAGSSPRIPGTIRTYGDGPTLVERAQARREASTVWLAQAQGLTDRAAFAVPDALRAGRTSLGAENSVLRQAHDAKMRGFARKFAPTFTQPLRSYYASGTMLRATVGFKYQIPSLPRSSRRDR